MPTSLKYMFQTDQSNFIDSIWIHGSRCPSRHIAIGCRFALLISDLLKWQSKLHNQELKSAHRHRCLRSTNTVLSNWLQQSVHVHVSADTEAWLGNHGSIKSQRAHEAANSNTSSKGEETTSQKKADGNCRLKVKFLLKAGLTSDSCRCPLCRSDDDHLRLKFLSLFSSSSGLTEPPTRDYMAAARFDTSLLRSTQRWGGGGGGQDKNGWTPLERQRTWLTKGRKTNSNNSDAITGRCAKQTNGGVVTGPEQRKEAL